MVASPILQEPIMKLIEKVTCAADEVYKAIAKDLESASTRLPENYSPDRGSPQ
jgi:hypothetical protein